MSRGFEVLIISGNPLGYQRRCVAADGLSKVLNQQPLYRPTFHRTSTATPLGTQKEFIDGYK